ncbi:MAG: outer membrane protein assembly factor BamA [Candidatus Binatia bacterium]
MERNFGLLIAAVCLGFPRAASSLRVDRIDPARTFRVGEVEIEGADAFSEGALEKEILTQERPWYTPWRSDPEFQPDTFTKDLERLKRFYETHGYYGTEISYDLEVGAEDGLTVRLRVKEAEPVKVASVEAGVKHPEKLPLPETIPIQAGDVFTEPDYVEGEQALLRFFLERGYPHVEIERSAEIDLARREARVRYVVTPGERAQFGETAVAGNEDVTADVIRREIEWEPRERFSLEDIRYTRENLLALDLFRSVRVGWKKTDEPWIVPMEVEVREKPPREIRVGVGYGTEDQYRAQFRWEHNDWLGGARELAFNVKYSGITSSIGAQLTQRHFPMRWTKGILEFRQDQENEDTYLLYASRLKPRFERRFFRTLTVVLGVSFTWHKFNEIDEETVEAIGAVREEGVSFGPAAGLVWNTTDDVLDPTRGQVVSLFADQTGAFSGGDYQFWKFALEGKKYFDVGWRTIFATRLLLGTGDTLDAIEDVPLSERFYAGGEKSVRGYGRRRLGPKSDADDPIGGLSLAEGSVELRRPIWAGFGGALFFDFGQVSLDPFDFPFGDLDFGAGPGFYYSTPVGPIRLDVGFPFDPPPGDSSWRIHFSIGQFF